MKKNIKISEQLKLAQELKRKNKIDEAIVLLENVNKKVTDVNVVRVLVSFLMATSNYEKVVAIPQIKKYIPRNYIIAKSLLEGELNSPEPICLSGHLPLVKAAYISMIKDEEDIIFFNLLWHYQLGLRKFFIINNLSTDRSLEYIQLFDRLFDDAQVYVLHDPEIAYYQSGKTTGACRFVMTLWPDIEWLVLTDADEFLCPMRPLHEILDNIPSTIGAIIVPKSFYNLVQGDSAYDNDLFFRRIQHRTPITHTSSKAIMRANMQYCVSQGNHRILDHTNTEISNYHCSLNLIYREFRIRSYSHYKKKVLNGGRAIEAAKQKGFLKVGGGHWEALYNLYLKEGENGLDRHLDKSIKKENIVTTILDPMPLDVIIKKISPQKNIGDLPFKID